MCLYVCRGVTPSAAFTFTCWLFLGNAMCAKCAWHDVVEDVRFLVWLGECLKFFFVSYVLQHDSHLRDVFYAFFSLSLLGAKIRFSCTEKQHSGLNITNSLQKISQFCALDSPLSLSTLYLFDPFRLHRVCCSVTINLSFVSFLNVIKKN